MHGTTLEQIHFHEVGTLDALADVVGCALLIHMLAPEQLLASPVHVGNGFIRCAHRSASRACPGYCRAPARHSLLHGFCYQRAVYTDRRRAPKALCHTLFADARYDNNRNRLRYGYQGFSKSQTASAPFGAKALPFFPLKMRTAFPVMTPFLQFPVILTI